MMAVALFSAVSLACAALAYLFREERAMFVAASIGWASIAVLAYNVR